jgi:hypothetical protein
MAYALELADGIVLARGLPGALPSFSDVVEVDGRSWRVLEVRHRYGEAVDGERGEEHVAIVEAEDGKRRAVG